MRRRIVEKNLNEHIEQENRAYRKIIRKAVRDIDPDANSHAGVYEDFAVTWRSGGWYVLCSNEHDAIGPFHTSQAAFGAAKDAIDQLVAEGK